MALPLETDEELMRRVIERDQQAMRLLVERHKDIGFTLAKRIVTDEQGSEEALQDAFLRVWRSAHTFGFNATFKTWFYRILYNSALTTRKRRGQLDDHIELVPEHASAESAPLEHQERITVIAKSLEQLPERQRIVLTLHYLQELSVDEIGEITGMPAGTIKTHLFRGRERLRHDVSLKEYANG